MVVLGDREVESGDIAPRLRKDIVPYDRGTSPEHLLSMIDLHSKSRRLK